MIKNSIIFITTTFDDVATILDKSSIFTFDATSRSAWNDGEDNKHAPSGVIVLGIFSLLCEQKTSGTLWGKHHHISFKKILKNTINKTNFHNNFYGVSITHLEIWRSMELVFHQYHSIL